MDDRIGVIFGMPHALRVIGVLAPVPRTRSRGISGGDHDVPADHIPGLIKIESLIDLEPQPAGLPMADIRPQNWAEEFPNAPPAPVRYSSHNALMRVK
jgi:hypothetical protein